MKSSKKEITLVAGLMFILGLIFTYPLILHFNTAIPYTRFSDGEMPILKSGDHLQLYYWFWLLKDNLFGDAVSFSNPYEFNMIDKQVPQGFHMFPFSLLFLIFTPFGNIFAYNATVILSFVLAGASMYLLAKFYTGSKTAALISSLIFSLAPFRVSQLVSHLNGFIFFFFPLIIYLFELSYKKGSLCYAILCGILIYFLSLMEQHLIYYLFILLGIYIPLRILSFIIDQRKSEFPSLIISLPQWVNRYSGFNFLVVIGAGIILVIFSQMTVAHYHDMPFFSQDFYYSLLAYPPLFFITVIFFSALYSLLTPLTINQAFTVEALSYLPIYLLPIYFIQFAFDVPHLGKILLFIVLGMIFSAKIFLLNRYGKRSNFPFMKLSEAELKKIISTIAPIFFLIALTMGYFFYMKMDLLSGSIAREGRTLHEIALYSPEIQDIFQRVNYYSEKYVYLGIIPTMLAFFILGTILFSTFRQKASTAAEKIKLAFLSFFALTFILSYILSLGLSFGEMSLYKLFYYYFPYFNYPRIPGRIVIVSFFSLSILAGYAIKELQSKFKLINKERLFIGVSVLLALGIITDYYPFRPMGITTLSKENDTYRYVKENIGDKILLELPLWPGDSHQSSLYEYYTTLDQVKRVNGFSPVVSKEYVDTVFWPLYSLNSGHIDENQYSLLNQLKVKYITVHNNRDVFTRKVSPYPSLFTVRRLMNSPFVDFIKHDNDIYLFEVNDNVTLLPESRKISSNSPVISNVYGTNRLNSNTGTVIYDKETDNQVIWGNAKNDPMNFLTFGPYVFYPQGKYLVYFRLKVNDNKKIEPVVKIEVSSPHEGKETILAKKDLRGVDFLEAGEYQDFYLNFDLARPTLLEFRTFFYKETDLWAEKVIVSYADQEYSAPFFEAENLLGNTGELVKDPSASGGKAIFADSMDHSLDYLIYGPYRKYPPGNYRVLYRIKIDQSYSNEKAANLQDIATIDVTSDSDRHILASRSLNSSDFNSGDYHLIPLDLNLDRENELSFRVRFNKKINIWLDKVEINSLE